MSEKNALPVTEGILAIVSLSTLPDKKEYQKITDIHEAIKFFENQKALVKDNESNASAKRDEFEKARELLDYAAKSGAKLKPIYRATEECGLKISLCFSTQEEMSAFENGMAKNLAYVGKMYRILI